MSAVYATRLKKLEARRAARKRNTRCIAWVFWRSEEETEEECVVRHGYDVSQIHRIGFARWLTQAEDDARREKERLSGVPRYEAPPRPVIAIPAPEPIDEPCYLLPAPIKTNVPAEPMPDFWRRLFYQRDGSIQ